MRKISLAVFAAIFMAGSTITHADQTMAELRNDNATLKARIKSLEQKLMAASEESVMRDKELAECRPKLPVPGPAEMIPVIEEASDGS